MVFIRFGDDIYSFSNLEEKQFTMIKIYDSNVFGKIYNFHTSNLRDREGLVVYGERGVYYTTVNQQTNQIRWELVKAVKDKNVLGAVIKFDTTSDYVIIFYSDRTIGKLRYIHESGVEYAMLSREESKLFSEFRGILIFNSLPNEVWMIDDQKVHKLRITKRFNSFQLTRSYAMIDITLVNKKIGEGYPLEPENILNIVHLANNLKDMHFIIVEKNRLLYTGLEYNKGISLNVNELANIEKFFQVGTLQYTIQSNILQITNNEGFSLNIEGLTDVTYAGNNMSYLMIMNGNIAILEDKSILHRTELNIPNTIPRKIDRFFMTPNDIREL